MQHITRRSAIHGAIGTLALASFAGCLGDDDDDADDTDDADDADPADRADQFLSDQDASMYDGELADQTGEDEITILVGADDDGMAFDPPGVRVDTGTTVVWEWTGEGGNHNVAAEPESDWDDFGYDDLTDEEGYTHEYTFDEAGLAAYVCSPHAGNNMYGAVVVE